MTEQYIRKGVEPEAAQNKTLLEILHSLEGKIDDDILSTLRAKAEADASALANAKKEKSIS